MDSEHSRPSSALRDGPRDGGLARAHRLGRPVSRAVADELAEVTPATRSPTHLEHGPEDHDRLGDAHEQGPRADRGALPVRPPVHQIEVVVHPTSIVHALVRFRDGAALAHLGYPDMRVPISYALTYPERAATEVPHWTSPRADARVPGARPGGIPAARARARGGRARGDRAVRLQRGERGRRLSVPRRNGFHSGDRRDRRPPRSALDRSPARDLGGARRADAQTPPSRREP